jgi:hypothetical protein
VWLPLCQLSMVLLARPEILGQGQGTCVQQFTVFQRFVVFVVFGGQAQGPCLDAHVDIFRHQNHFPLREFVGQRLNHAQNLVVGLALRQAGGKLAVERFGLEIQHAARRLVAGG